MSERQAESMVRSNATRFVNKTLLSSGDIIKKMKITDLAGLAGQKRKRKRVEGAVVKSHEHVLSASSTLRDALQADGVPTPNAYVNVSGFGRGRARAIRQQNYESALRDFETQFTAATSIRCTSNAEEVATLTSACAANSRLVKRLRSVKVTSRVVPNVTPPTQDLPNSMLEDSGCLSAPARSAKVGVLSRVVGTGGRHLYSPDRTVANNFGLAGGATCSGDHGNVFDFRANGLVISHPRTFRWLACANQVAGQASRPGNTVFVPEELSRTTWTKNAKNCMEITQQLCIILAGIKSATH